MENSDNKREAEESKLNVLVHAFGPPAMFLAGAIGMGYLARKGFAPSGIVVAGLCILNGLGLATITEQPSQRNLEYSE